MGGRVHLGRKLTLESLVKEADGAGGFRANWVARGDLWAEVVARTGREASGEATALSATSYKITVRAMPYGAPERPVPGERFREGERIFAIQAVAERDAKGRYLTCFANEEVVV